jgi:hypothetical protein
VSTLPTPAASPADGLLSHVQRWGAVAVLGVVLTVATAGVQTAFSVDKRESVLEATVTERLKSIDQRQQETNQQLHELREALAGHKTHSRE